jgi:hypothetical protein
MGLVDLFFVASTPVLKVLLLTLLGSFLALDRIDIMGENAMKQLNTVSHYFLHFTSIHLYSILLSPHGMGLTN